MAEIRQQIIGIIKTCETAMAAKEQPNLDGNTMEVAGAILKKAQTDYPNDEILKAANLDAPLSWVKVLSAMQTVIHSLPIQSSPAVRQVGGVGKDDWMR